MKNKLLILLVVIILTLMIIGIVFLNSRKTNKPGKLEPSYNDNDFNFNLIKAVNKNTQNNYLISPYSIEIALNMLKDGANGNTLKEINDVIGTRTIKDITIKDRVSIANAAFIKNKYKNYILSDYYNKLNNNYNSEILYDEFKTPKVINDWVNNKTNGMIDKILGDISDDFVLGLANALAIDVEWYSPFECQSTSSEEFKKSDGSKYDVEMMHEELKTDTYTYLENDKAKGIIIPYKSYNKKTGEEDYESDDRLEFIAILPNDKNINNYINNLDKKELNNLLSSKKEIGDKLHVNLSLPRFKYDYEIDKFMDVLKDLGIKEAFNPTDADFTNIMNIQEEVENLYIGVAVHKTHIDLNEKGTKAAAVTFFGLYAGAALMPEHKTINLKFNRPFAYIIRDKNTEEMLFFGVVYEPNKWTGTTCSNTINEEE